MSTSGGVAGIRGRASRSARRIGSGLAPALLCVLAVGAPPSAANSTSAENALPGDPHWYRPIAPETSVDIYASQISAAPGDTLLLHVSAAPGTRYKLLIYRLGWYQGSGARLIGCVPACASDRVGQQYPAPAPDLSIGFLDAGWPVTDSFQIPATAVSGYYLAEAVATTGSSAGRMRYYPFVIHALPSTPAAHILVQIPVNTEEAYNPWGGKSLYAYNSTGEKAALKVSFNRPFQGLGAGSPTLDSYQLVRFLERAGYDVSYITDVDTDGNPSELRRHKLVVAAGHDEYWTKGMRDAFDGAREAGVNLADFGANTAYWQMRYEDGDRTIVEYRSALADPEADPVLKTVQFQQLAVPRPPCELFGVQYQDGFDKYLPSKAPLPYTVMQAASASTWFAGTGLVPGAVLPSLVGYEWDTIIPGCKVPPLTDLFHWTGTGVSNADATVYAATSGARVFAAGSLDFATGLDEWPGKGQGVENVGLQHFTVNMLTDLGDTSPATLDQLFPKPTPAPPAPKAAPEPPQQITALRISPARFRAAGRGVAIARRRVARVGATVIYADTRAGQILVAISKHVRTRCRRSTRRHIPVCVRRVTLGLFIGAGRAGTNHFHLSGRLHGHRLPPGRYLLTATPQSGLGARGSRSASFRIVR